jgi:glucokinase
MRPNFLGIEIGGTKLQLGIGPGDGALLALERASVDPAQGARGILEQIDLLGRPLVDRYNVRGIGIGFGGPIDRARGLIVKSHHVSGWESHDLVGWCERAFGLPTILENDCDAAGLAEARFGAGQGSKVVLFVTVGTGIGGGLVIHGEIYRASGRGATEIGHLRPGLLADRPDQTVESLASGWGIAASAQARLSDPITRQTVPLASRLAHGSPAQIRQELEKNEEAESEYTADLWERCDGRPEQLTAQLLALAAGEGNEVARQVVAHACQALGWAIAQAITLLSPDVVVIGGGVSLMDDSLFLVPLRSEVDRYVFPALLGSCELRHAHLGEQVVVHGAITAAADAVNRA